jgi:hypothetical protein
MACLLSNYQGPLGNQDNGRRVFDVIAETEGFFPANDPGLPLPHPTARCRDFDETVGGASGCGAAINVNACDAVRAFTP